MATEKNAPHDKPSAKKSRHTKLTPQSQKTRKTKTPPNTQTKDPKGGLTAAGRAEFKRTDGANLRPGVKKAMTEMSPDDMRRKGSWATRFYGRKKLPPLVDKKGEPTRFALSAAAWGEPVPKTEAAARRIAAKGRKLLDAYRKKNDTAGSRDNGRTSATTKKRSPAL